MSDSACIDHGRRSAIGYARSGSAALLGKERLLHRQMFLDKHGYLPEVVMHSCDNPRCINMDHLRAGTWNLNNKDRAAKGRSAQVVLTRRKITTAQALEIKRRWPLKRPTGKDPDNGVMRLAKDFGVDPGVIYNIVKGKTHREA